MRILTNTLIAACWLFSTAVVAQTYLPTMETFGKNRIQYQRFDWKILTTANFEIYYYQDGQTSATLAAQYAESEFDRITELLGYTPFNRTRIFVFNSVQDMVQSNIGLGVPEGEDAREINLQKSRVLAAFSGNQAEFKRQLIQGIAGVFVYDMLYGGSLKESLQSSLLLTLPDWFMAGIESYIAEGWSVKMDDFMRETLLDKRLRKPSILSGQEARYVGHSIWNYIAERYGKDNISNILNLTRIIRNEQTSIASTLGLSYSRFLREWRDYYGNMATQLDAYQSPRSDLRVAGNTFDKGYKMNRVRLSADQQYIAYTTNDFGKFAVEVIDTKKPKDKNRILVLTGGHKSLTQPLNPYNPLVSWQKNNNMAVIFEDEGRLFLHLYGFEEKTGKKLKLRKPLKSISQVNEFDISDDGSAIVMSAEKKGQNDLYLYRINANVTQQLTNDLYDDLYPQFVGKSNTQIAFTSNRLNDTLNIDKGTYKTINDQFNLFVHSGEARAETVTRIIDSLGVISRPIAPREGLFYFMSDEKGIRNVYRYELENNQLTQLTNFKYNLKDFDLNTASGALVFIASEKEEEFVGYQAQNDLNRALNLPATQRSVLMGQGISGLALSSLSRVESSNKKNGSTPEVEKEKPSLTQGITLLPGEVDTDNYQFDIDSFKSVEKRNDRTERSPRQNRSDALVRNARRENIKIKGPADYQDMFLYNGSTGALVIDPLPMRGLGYSTALTMNDLLENHLMKAGVFITPNLRNSDLFAEYSYLPNRIDYSIRVDRRTFFLDDPTSQKYRYNRVAVSAAYPISQTTRVVLSPSYSTTRFINLNEISFTDRTSDYAGLRGEFVFDNTTTNGMYMLEGTRAKFRADYYQGIGSGSESFNRISIDVRNYTKIHREMILATRFSASTSGGAAPKRVFLGGVDNWLFNRYDRRNLDDPLNFDLESSFDKRDLFFSDFATTLRGFNLNKAAGRSHMLLNVELRMPLVKYFYRGPITSNFLRNFQLVAFSDVGTAWSGSGPFEKRYESPIPKPNPFQASVNTFKNPFLIGYGAGVRTMLFGYYVKLDVAWGLEDKIVNAPMTYLSLGRDF
jgi:Tol biopolymer transport system component